MIETAIVELDKSGSVVLPEEIRRDLPAGTRFLVRRQDHNIILVALPPQPSTSFDLSAEAFDFANELTAEGYDDYLAQLLHRSMLEEKRGALTTAEMQQIDERLRSCLGL